MKRKTTGFFITMLMMLIMAGCATQRAWTYKAEPPVTTAPMINKSVSVSPLLDGRENVNKNMVMMYLIPLMPFGWQDFKTPEGVQVHLTSGLWQFKPAEDFAKAIAEELNNSGIFKEAFFTNRSSEGDLFFKGEIKSTDYNGKMISYCFSIEGPLLWLIGLPASTVENVLALSLQLVDPKTNEVLWAESYEKRDGNTSWIYALQPDFLYDRLLKEIMKEVIPSLKNKLANYQK
jgi:curli biogenesis system outer membrane secretion channel CsgG